MQIDPYGVASLNKQLKLSGAVATSKAAKSGGGSGQGVQGTRMTSALDGQRHEIANSVLFDQNNIDAGVLTRTTSTEKLEPGAINKKMQKQMSSSIYGTKLQKDGNKAAAAVSSLDLSGKNIQSAGYETQLGQNQKI